jgi:hypothetical protein
MLQTRYAPQCRGFAAAGGAKQNDDFTGSDREGHVVDGGFGHRRSFCGGEDLPKVLDA